MKPDKTHVHHILLHAGFSPRQTLAIIIAVGAIFHGNGVALHFSGCPDSIQLVQPSLDMHTVVIPAQAGIYHAVDPRLRGDDGHVICMGFSAWLH